MAPINTGKEGNPMKKNLRVPVLAAALAGAMVLGAGATTVAERVSADLRPDITVTVDGKDQTLLDKNGDVVYPITYEGTTYLPIRALGNVMDRRPSASIPGPIPSRRISRWRSLLCGQRRRSRRSTT